MVLRLFILLLILASCSNKTWHFAESDTEFHKVDYRVRETIPAIDSLIAPYKNQIDATMNEVIGEVAMDLTKRRPESTLGNWISDLLLDEVNELVDKPIDFAFQNYGGLRVPTLPKGNVTRGKIFELMPFENQVVILRGSGEPMQMLFDKMAGSGGWPISGGVQMTISDTIATDISIGGEPFDPDRTYSFVCSDYIADGGSDCGFLLDMAREEPGVLIRDVIINHIVKRTAEGGKMQSSITGRIKKDSNE